MINNLTKVLYQLKGRKVLVIGDVILDEYVYGNVRRISPEAPIPLVEVYSKIYTPGGAGNVANNILVLGGEVYLIGVIGKDNNAQKLCQVLKERHINTDFLVIDAKKPTSLKSRIIAQGQQILRIDYEEIKALNTQIEANILETVNLKIKDVDAIIISDYGKGVITSKISKSIISSAKSLDKLVVVDPKGKDYNKYRQATFLGPNQREIEEISGRSITSEVELIDVGKRLLRDLDLSYVLIKKGERGMSLIGKDGMLAHIPAITAEVYDPTGAGDTVTATLTLALAAGAGIKDAARLANFAAGVVVRKVGTAVPTLEAIEQITRSNAIAEFNLKIVNVEELEKIIAKLKERGKKIVFTNGCFDLIHVGHVRYLQEAKNLGDILIVAINSDNSTKKIKGEKRPILREEERAQIIAALESVDYVTIFSADTPNKLITNLRPDVYVKGGDYQLEKLPETKVLESHGGKVVIVDEIKDRSTTKIINTIIERFFQKDNI